MSIRRLLLPSLCGALLLGGATTSQAVAQSAPPPIIDVHLHALPADGQGPPPIGLCMPFVEWPRWDQREPYPMVFLAELKNPKCENPVWSPVTDSAMLEQTLEVLERRNLMHAGWPMLDDLLALMYAHPQVHVDVGVIAMVLPRAEFHAWLERIVRTGFHSRVMFGSDQMQWPGGIERAIEAIESAAFLSASQKRDIFYHNAVRFLRLSEREIARHHRGGK